MSKLIYGKQNIEKIVSIEIIDDQAELYIQTDDGSIELLVQPNEFYLLSNKSHGKSWMRLKGDLHYCWAKKFKKATDYYKEKAILKKQGADVFSISDDKEAFMVKNGFTYYRGLNPIDISVLSFDIESTSLDHTPDSKVLLISNTFRKNGEVTRRLFAYDKYESQGDMLVAWCDWVRSLDPNIILGHNIYSYDLPYMRHIADMEGVQLCLGRDDSPLDFFNYESFKRIDGGRKQAYNKVRCFGRELIDTMFLAINYDIGKKYESYGLKKIIAQEGLEREGRTFYDAATIRYNYTNPNEWEKIKDYCADDSDDSLALFDLMAPAFFYLTQAVPKSFQDIVESASGAQINSMMIRSYIQEGHSIPKASDAVEFEGAISFGNPGIYHNAFKVDVASLYPSIMINYEVYDRVKDPKGHMLEMVKTFTAERLKNKRLAKETGIKYYDDMQNAQKIVINSMYGFMGASGLTFNSPDNAAFVTRMGREILQKAIKWAIGKELVYVITNIKKDGTQEYEWQIPNDIANDRKFNLINCDTDSITFCSIDNKDLSDDIRKSLLEEINNMYPPRIRFEDDGYYKSIIVLKAKNYILYDGKKIKVKGSALKDAKKELALKEFLFKVIDSIINNTNHYDQIYHAYIKEAMNVTDITRWSSKKTISAKVLTSERSNESKIRDAIDGEEIVEGDKVWVYFKSDNSLGLADSFDGDYNKERMLEKVYKTALVFENVLDKSIFLNYKLKRNKPLLEKLLNENN